MPITTRAAKGSALTHTELDTNFTELAAAVAFLTPADTAYTAAVPLTGTLYMPQTSVTGAIVFTVVAGPLKGANTYLRLVANGTNTPTFTGMREWGGSSGFDNRNGIVNQIQFFNDGVDSWYSISQEVGAVAVPAAATAVSMTGPTTGVTGVASTAFSIGITPLGGAITGTVVVTPSDAAAGGTFAPTSVSLTTAAPAATFTYTPSSTGAKTISVTNNGGLTNPANITYTASATATAPGAPTIGTATGGDASASVAFTAPASNGGSAITGYTVTSSPGGLTATGVASPLNVTGLTNGTAYTFSVTATNAIGTGTASAASNSVTPAAAGFPQMVTLEKMVQSGSGPFVYTGSTAGTFNGGEGDTISKKLASGSDGSITIQITTMAGQGSNEILAGFDTAATALQYSNYDYLVVGRTPSWRFYRNATDEGGGSVSAVNNCRLRIARIGSTLVFSRSLDSGATYQEVKTYTGVATGDAYFHIGCVFAGSYVLLETSGLVA